MNRHPHILTALLLAAQASTSLAAKANFDRSKPHVNISACVDALNAAAVKGTGKLVATGDHWGELIDFHLTAGRPEVEIGLLLPAVQQVREAARRAERGVDKTAAGCIRALTLAGKDEDVPTVEDTSKRLAEAIRHRARSIIETLQKLGSSGPR